MHGTLTNPQVLLRNLFVNANPSYYGGTGLQRSRRPSFVNALVLWSPPGSRQARSRNATMPHDGMRSLSSSGCPRLASSCAPPRALGSSPPRLFGKKSERKKRKNWFEARDPGHRRWRAWRLCGAMAYARQGGGRLSAGRLACPEPSTSTAGPPFFLLEALFLLSPSRRLVG